jgi:hypothetical protein
MTIYELYIEKSAAITAMEKSYAAEIEVKRTSIEQWLKMKQKTCHHKDTPGSMFYFTCSECGLVGE